MNNHSDYKIFGDYILRTPLFSFTKYRSFTSNTTISDSQFKSLCNDPIFKEAIFIASPSFYFEMIKFSEDRISDENSKNKIKFSILKYFSRMSSRCTPFGLFAGFSVGEFGTKSKIELSQSSHYKRHTRLDMNYLVALSQDLMKRKDIRDKLLFFPNSSIYKAGNKIRYVEYHYVKSSRRHDIIAVEDSVYLSKILLLAKNGSSLTELAESITDDDVSLEEAKEFLEELVDAQILTNELEPSVSGPEFLEQIRKVLLRIEVAEDVLKTLLQIEEEMKKLDDSIGNDPEDYLIISKMVESLGTKFELRYLFQIDMITGCTQNNLNFELGSDLEKAFAFLNKITLPSVSTALTKFKEAFLERYESREVSLAKALDVDMGIGFLQNQFHGDVNPLVDDLSITTEIESNSYVDIKWSFVNSVLLKKNLQEPYTIKLTDEDFDKLIPIKIPLPDTLSTIIEIINVGDNQKIRFYGAGGSSSAMLMGRFCHIDQKVANLVNEIVEVEGKIAGDSKILAEIVHLPESRLGNVIMRPDFRKYEIPYLSNSLKPTEFQIPISDLFISMRPDGRLILRSKKLNKEILPRMGNAHNFDQKNSLPIYNFLCSMQTQDLRQGLGIDFGPLTTDYEFTPRIEYKNIILKDAFWNVNVKAIDKLLKHQDDEHLLMLEIIEFRKRLKIPDYVLLSEGDNKLLINFKNLTSVKMLLNMVKNDLSFRLQEFLYNNKEEIVKRGNEQFNNQFIVSFFNQNKLSNLKS